MEIEKHQFMPRHVLLSDTEKEDVLKKYGITSRQLPRILATDPAIVKFGCKPGDVIKIERKSETAGEAVYYRVVVK